MLSSVKLLTTKQAADLLGLSPRTLEKNRVLGCSGLPFIRLGRTIRYSVADLEAHIAACRRRSTSDPGQEAS